MRVGLVWAEVTPLTNITVRYERYARGFRALGHEPVTVCIPAAAVGYGEPVEPAPDVRALRDPEFYRELGLDAAVVITWLGIPDVVSALKAACPWVVSVADSDGRISPRLHPRATLVRSVLQHRGPVARARAAKFWVRRYLTGDGPIRRTHLASAAAADAIAVNSPGARDHLTEFLRQYGRDDLIDRIVVVPYPVDEEFLTGDVSPDRDRRIVAVGRWDDPQKDAPLLAASIRRTIAADAGIGFDLVGPGGESIFAKLARRHPQVRYHGRQPAAVVAGLLRRARALVISSRWESGPIVANEAVCLGATVIGPAAVPTVVEFGRTNEFGTACPGRSPKALSAAILAEMAAWDRGGRNPRTIAARWRPYFDPRTVCPRLLDPPAPPSAGVPG